MAAGSASGSETANATQAARLVELLGSGPLFAPVSTTVRGQLAERLIRFELAVGDAVPKTDPPAGLFVVESGRLAVVVRNARTATTQVVATLGSPQAFGVSALVSDAADGDE